MNGMKRVMDREQALHQIELVLQGKGGQLMDDRHLPVLLRVRDSLKNDKEITIDDFILLACYRDTVRRIHLQDLNKNHPCHKKTGVGRGKGKKDKSFYKSAEYREKLRKAQMGRKDKPETIAKRAAKVKASWAVKRASAKKK